MLFCLGVQQTGTAAGDRQPRRRLSPLVMAGAIVIGSLLVLCLGLWATMHSLFATHAKPADMEQVSRWAPFPKGARLVHSLAVHHGIDSELYAEVQFDRADLPQFLSALKKERATLSRTDRLGLTNSMRNRRKGTLMPEWWRPDSANDFIACRNYLLVSLDDPKSVTVWLHTDTDDPPKQDKHN